MRLPQDWRRARVTLAIAGATVIAWLFVVVVGWEQDAAFWGGFIPARVEDRSVDHLLAPVWLTPLTTTLVHGGFAHLAFNVIILLFCGRAVEGLIGPKGFAALYLTAAFVSVAAEYAVSPGSATPIIGASGAVSAVVGAYSLLFGRNRVRVASERAAQWLNVLWMAAAFIALQALTGFTFQTAGVRIAIAAHIGGFLWGLMLARPLLFLRFRKA